ncbi:hypothetical protein EX30DRAFT_245597 [Ascodesmis nigricans]|uniref:Uncharacterized protein n=1 Tax=Ascodesmis nigricans TaxID=341454 RepID=A0A4S2MMW8_9PEZI|nr:hypothetical protein EX30DRAFT_245597 [Ascodesmis nigricans]
MALPRWEKRKHERAQKVALIRHNLLRYVHSIFPKQTAAVPAAKLTGRGYICSSSEKQKHDAMEFMFVPLTPRAQDLFGNKYGLHSWPKTHQLEDMLKMGEVEVKLVQTGETSVGGCGRGEGRVRMSAGKRVSVVGVGKRRRIVDSWDVDEEEEQEDEVEDVANTQLRMEAAASESASGVAVSRRLRSTRVTRSSESSRSSATRGTRSSSSASKPQQQQQQQQQQRERSKRRRTNPPTPPDPNSSSSSSSSSPEPRPTRRLRTRSYPPSSASPSSASSNTSTATPASPPLKPDPTPLPVSPTTAATTPLPPTPFPAPTPAPLSPSTFTPLDFSTPTSATASRMLLLQAAESVSLQARQRYTQILTLVEKNRDLERELEERDRRVRMLEGLVGKLEREIGQGGDAGTGLSRRCGGEKAEGETGG